MEIGKIILLNNCRATVRNLDAKEISLPSKTQAVETGSGKKKKEKLNRSTTNIQLDHKTSHKKIQGQMASLVYFTKCYFPNFLRK